MAEVTAPPGSTESSAYPLTVVEQTIAEQGWEYERDESSVEINWKGAFVPYFIKFTWMDEIETLHLSCAFDFKVLTPHLLQVRELLTVLNENLWAGHCDLWRDDGVVLYRYGLLLSGGSEITSQQCEAMIELATGFCDRYYPAFHYIVWGGKTAHEALQIVEFETEGEA
jgi:hypothetical protein